MSNLFRGPAQVPEHITSVEAFRATAFKTFSRDDKDFHTALASRLETAARLFGMRSAGTAENGRTVFRDDSARLHVYHPSDSFWWTSETLSSREAHPDGTALPNEKEVPQLAQKELERLRVGAGAATLTSINFDEVALRRGQEKPRVHHLAVNANYGFTLNRLPVFGPGAKIKLSFIDGSRLAQAIYFWRTPARGEPVKTISPQDALDQFHRDPAFFRLDDAQAVVDIHAIQLGYYALPPAEFQRFYIPVYAIDATTRTRELPQYDFRRFVLAIRLSPDAVKRRDAVANPAACRMF